jgi:phage pi2 protein 07
MTEAKEIAKEVAKELKRTQSIVVTATDIALMCAYTPGSTPVRQILEDPTFPPCVSLVEGGTRRYLRKDVERWIERKFADESKLTLQTLRL